MLMRTRTLVIGIAVAVSVAGYWLGGINRYTVHVTGNGVLVRWDKRTGETWWARLGAEAWTKVQEPRRMKVFDPDEFLHNP